MDCFASLEELDFGIEDILGIRQQWQSGRVFSMPKPRPGDALLLFESASAVCKRPDKEDVYIPCGSLVHMAMGSVYEWHFESKEPIGITYLFQFTLRDREGRRILTGDGVNLLHDNRFEMYRKSFYALAEEYGQPRRSPAAIKGAAYRLLSLVMRDRASADMPSGDTALIREGIRYLGEDPRGEKSIAEISAMCGVSVNYFERLFKRYAGVTPTEYRLGRKLENACRFILFDNMTLEQIAEELGFGDSAYLCRFFRARMGMTPSEYRRLHKYGE